MPNRVVGGAGAGEISTGTVRRLQDLVIKQEQETGESIKIVFPDGFDNPLALQAERALMGTPPITVSRPEAAKRESKLEYEKIFFEAVKLNNLEVLQWTFEAGIHDPNCKDKHGLTLLHHAKSPAVAAWLIEQGADVTQSENPFGYTPLHTAENALMVDFFVEQGLSPWEPDRSGQLPICHVEDAVTAKALVEQAIIDESFLASDETLRAMPKEKLREMYVSQRSNVHTSPLTCATDKANFAFRTGAKATELNELVAYFLSLNADTCTFDEWGQSPLEASVSLGNCVLVDILLEGGASPNDFRVYHQPVLNKCKDPVMAQKLIDHGADLTSAYMVYGGLDGKTKTMTALQAAEANGHSEVADVIRKSLEQRKLKADLAGQKWFFVD